MSIRNDNWIRQQCEKPTHMLKYPNGNIEYMSEPFCNDQIVQMYTNTISSNKIIDYEHNLSTNSVIKKMSKKELSLWKPMIEPFVNTQIKNIDGKKIVSYGLSSFGYDVRLSNKFKLFTNINKNRDINIIDPLDNNSDYFVDIENDYCIIPPNSYLLGHTIEYFRIPKDVLVLCVGKSTYARLGAIINCTPIEPEFCGQVVIEISNSTNLPLKVYANQGIAQFMFFQSVENCNISYKDKNGKYQNQTGITLAKL